MDGLLVVDFEVHLVRHSMERHAAHPEVVFLLFEGHVRVELGLEHYLDVAPFLRRAIDGSRELKLLRVRTQVPLGALSIEQLSSLHASKVLFGARRVEADALLDHDGSVTLLFSVEQHFDVENLEELSVKTASLIQTVTVVHCLVQNKERQNANFVAVEHVKLAELE